MQTREQRNAYGRRYNALYPERQRAGHLKHRYGLSLADYDAMLAAQGEKCKICGATKPGGRGKNFFVDHDHTTGKVRGLLCARCDHLCGLAKGTVRPPSERVAAYLRGM